MSLIEEVKEVIIAVPVVSKLYMSVARVSMNIQIMLLFLYKLILNSLGIDPSTVFSAFDMDQVVKFQSTLLTREPEK